MDIVCVNRYPAWYSDPGQTDLIQLQVKNELITWHRRFKKPVLITEYGAGSVIGMHTVGQYQHSLHCYHVYSSLFTYDKVNLLESGGKKGSCHNWGSALTVGASVGYFGDISWSQYPVPWWKRCTAFCRDGAFLDPTKEASSSSTWREQNIQPLKLCTVYSSRKH